MISIAKRNSQTLPADLMTRNEPTTASGASASHDVNKEYMEKKRSSTCRNNPIVRERQRSCSGQGRGTTADEGGAFGTFTVTNDITGFSKAKLFSEPGKETMIFARFSAEACELGSRDAERNIPSFSLKFFTEQGIWDILGSSARVSCFRGMPRVPSDHAIARDYRAGQKSTQNRRSALSLLPEGLHQLTIGVSDQYMARSFRHMQGCGNHTYSLVNAAEERFWANFTITTQQGVQDLADYKAQPLTVSEGEHATDLRKCIEVGDFPRWTLFVQIIRKGETADNWLNAFDPMKLWQHAAYPVMKVGELELNINPGDLFEDIERAAFSAANVVPGIELC